MSENQIISFLEFVNQDDEDKYNMLVESAAIIRQKENIIKEVREYIRHYTRIIHNEKTGDFENDVFLKEKDLKEFLEILDKEK